MGQVDFLILAYRLALLTFYLGVLVYALPIPYSGLKRWAPVLIADSIISAILALSLYYIFDYLDELVQLIGGSWTFFYTWMGSVISVLTALKSIVIALYMAPDPLGIISGLKSIIAPFDKLVTSALYLQAFIFGIAYLVKEYGKLLAVIGVALYAVPFRIARNSGAWLIAFSLVFHGGLQALPVFVSTLQPQPSFPGIGQVTENGVALANLTVYSADNKSLVTGLLHIYNYETGEELATYIVDNGTVQSESMGAFVTVPSKIDVYYVYEFMAVRFYMMPYPVSPGDYDAENGAWVLTLKSPHIVYSSLGILTYTNGEVIDDIIENNTVHATVGLGEGGYIEVREQDTCITLVNAPGLEGPYQGSWSWMGLEGYSKKFIAQSAGVYNITLTFQCQSLRKPSLDSNDYVSFLAIMSSFMDLNLIEAFLLYYFTIPSLYILMLASTAYGVARLIGGRERFPIRII